MHSAVLILPIALRDAGDQLAELMGWGPQAYTIPLASEGAGEPTHYGLRADAQPSFLAMLQGAASGAVPDGAPPELVATVVADLIADFSPDPANPDKHLLWGSDHLDAVCAAHGLTRLL
jgi:hypothetical protein